MQNGIPHFHFGDSGHIPYSITMESRDRVPVFNFESRLLTYWAIGLLSSSERVAYFGQYPAFQCCPN